MYQLSDGALTGTDVDIAISSIGSNVDACYDVINFMIGAEGQQILVDTMKTVPVNQTRLFCMRIKLKIENVKKRQNSLINQDFRIALDRS